MKARGLSGICLFALVMVMCFPVYGNSEEVKGRPDVYILGEVVVTGESEGVEAIASVVEITAEDIEQKNARSLDEAIELLPGLDVRTGGQGIPRVNLRGLRSRHVILLLNGIPYNSTYDGQFDPSIIPVENIAKIKVSYGGHSVLYGQGGLGGVINIITKKGTTGVSGGLSSEVDERGETLGRFHMSGGREQVDFFISGSVLNSDGYRLSDDFKATSHETGGLRENSDKERDNLFANIGYTPTKDWNIGLTLGNSGGEFGAPPSVNDDNTDPFYKKPKYDRVDDYDGFATQLAAAYNPDGPFGLRAWVFYNESEEDRARYDDDNYNAITNNKSFQRDDETRSHGVSLQASYVFGGAGRLTGTCSTQKDKYESDGEWGNGNPIDLNKDLNIHSLALEYEVSPFQNFEFVVGYGHYWLDKDVGNDDDQGSLLLGTRYHISEKTQARASVARKIRFPSIKQLYDPDDGNVDLTTEKSTNYELGITQVLPWDMEADLAGFLIDVEDYIEKDEATTNDFENHEDYRFKGIEFTLAKRFLSTGSVRGGYAYMDSDDRSSGSQKDDLEHRPKHKFTLEGRYMWDFGFSAYASFMYVGDQYYYTSSGALLKRKLNSYSLVDLKLKQRLIGDRFYAYVGVSNLFDKDYEESYGYPRAGRMVYGGLKVAY